MTEDYNEYDLDGDGVLSDDDIERSERLSRLDNNDKRQDAQRAMAWFGLLGMLLYPFAIIATVIADLETAGNMLTDVAPTYFVSVAAIVAAFYAKEGIEILNKKKDKE
jgi:hypothetical protein